MKLGKKLLFICSLGLLMLMAVACSQAGLPASVGKEPSPGPTPVEGSLPVVGTRENLSKLLEEVSKTTSGVANDLVSTNQAVPSMAPVPATEKAADTVAGAGNGDYSATNVQVAGVDEADIVKTDGKYIYKISNQKVVVAQVDAPSQMKVLSVIDYDQDRFPMELYVDDRYLTVISNQNHYTDQPIPMPMPRLEGAEATAVAPEKMMPYPMMESTIVVTIYDLADRSNLQVVREVEVSGQYLSSRKIQEQLYLVSNQWINLPLLREQPQSYLTPGYKDSVQGTAWQRTPYEKIHYFPDSPESNYLMITSIRLDQQEQTATEMKTYLGGGQTVYASLENLYVALPEYLYENNKMETNTLIYQFALEEGATRYLGQGRVPGTLLNQFSMDEHEGYFRVATTQQNWSAGANPSEQMSNQLTILDKGMKVVGSLENIAPGEQIYSVRFIGQRGYMVTFETVDPLFVLDLKDPTKPAILGELKIPGYSNYLHPYDENHILGFGKEAIEIEVPDGSGKGTMKNAYYLGMKIALFDVSDVSKPVEKYKIEIGDRGTESELFHNHKALLFSKEKNLLAFPVTIAEVDRTKLNLSDFMAKQDPRLAYGEPVFQGALVYDLTLEKGFQLKGKVTHQAAGELKSLYWNGKYDYNREVSRALYVGKTLYTISSGAIQANELQNMAKLGELNLP